MDIRRCHHVKVNGMQCGSPALRGKCYCYFHNNYRHLGAYAVKQRAARNPFKDRFPALEDANSIQAAVMQVIRLILARQIEPKEAGLLLYALQIASSNLRHLHLEPRPDHVVVDPLLVPDSPLGGKPVRNQHFEIETVEDQKERDERERQLEMSQQQADAEWEEETRREFAPTQSSADDHDDSSPRRGLITPTPEQIDKLFDARDAMLQHPGDPAFVRAYEDAWNFEEPVEEEASKT